MKKTIDLGKKYDDLEPAVAESEDSKEPTVHYPSLYLSDRPELAGLPDDGTATIKFHVVSRATNEVDGEKTISVELEIHSITADTEATAASEDESLDEIEKGLRDAEESETPEEEAAETPEEEASEDETPKKKK